VKSHLSIWVFTIISAIAGTCFAAAPHQLGPFILNHDISEFSEFVKMDTALPIRHMESIQEVEIQPIKGFKSGLIAYGSCVVKNRIVRIKLKYSDGSKAFYEKLKKRIDARYGKCDEYRGDPFHIVVGWKWSFIDSDGHKISLILQHNSRDEDEKMGNSIKLTMSDLLESEWKCYQERERMGQTSHEGDPSNPTPLEQLGWDLFVPR